MTADSIKNIFINICDNWVKVLLVYWYVHVTGLQYGLSS